MQTDTTLADLARDNPAATRVFLRHKLDFCCGGRRPLADACRELGLDAPAILAEIEHEGAAPPRAWTSLAQLADHIEAHFHAALRRELPPLIEAARKVERVHASKPAVPTGLADVLTELFDDMQQHMRKEESILFPMIRAGVRGQALAMPIGVMEAEHDRHGDRLARIRAITDDMQKPEHACATWRALYDGLVKLEADLMEHVHLENNVLFRDAR